MISAKKNEPPFLLEWGRRGKAEGEFDACVGIAVGEDEVDGTILQLEVDAPLLVGLRLLPLLVDIARVELHQEIREVEVGGRTVQHDAHRPFRRMGADIDHGPGEPVVRHAGHGNQELVGEINGFHFAAPF